MTNSINLIVNFIREQRLPQMLEWSRRRDKRSPRYKEILNKTREILELISGNQVTNLIKSKFDIIFYILIQYN